MSSVQSTDVAVRFLDALARRDFVALAETFNEDGRLRGLVPSAVREERGRVAIAGRFEFWNGSREDFELLDSEIAEMQDVVRLRWRARGIDPDDGPSLYEQTAYARIEGEGFAWMNLVCSGDRPTTS